jgi:hypothetical protein
MTVGRENMSKITIYVKHFHDYNRMTLDKVSNEEGRIGAGLEIAGCQWPIAGHIFLEMAGKNKFELPSKKNGR